LEKAVSERLRQHLKEIDGIPKHQSAYRRGHSTETALLKVINDLLLSADRGEVRALCLLDLSAAPMLSVSLVQSAGTVYQII